MTDQLLLQAVELYRKGEQEQAGALLARVLRQEPNNVDAWYGLALCVKEIERQVQCLQKVLELNPNHEKAKMLLDKLNSVNYPLETTNNNSKSHQKKMSSLKIGRLYLYSGIGALVVLGFAVLGLLFAIKNNYSNSDLPEATSNIPLSNITISPEQEYSQKIEKALIMLSNWNEKFNDWDILMTKEDSECIVDGNSIKYGDCLYFYFLSLEGRNILGFTDLRTLLIPEVLPLAVQIKSEGFELLSYLESINPPSSVKRPHEQIAACVEYEVYSKGAVITAINEGRIVEPIGQNEPCLLMEDSIKSIKLFIEQQELVDGAIN